MASFFLLDLPELVLREILSHLNVQEKCRLRAVCKHLQEYVDLSLQYLILYDFRSPLGHRWPSGERIQENEMARITTNENFNVLTFENRVFKNVKKLYLHQIKYARRLLYSLHHLKKLEVLSLHSCYDSCRSFVQLSLRLPNLKVISLRDTRFAENLNLHTPKLEKFYNRLCKYFKVRFKHPETLRFVESFYLNFGRGLVNLEELHCAKLSRSFDLNDYPNLKRLNIIASQASLPDAERVIEQRRRLNRFDLEILICGFRGSRITLKEDPIHFLQWFKFANTENLREFCGNYPKLVGRIPFNLEITYNELLEYFDPVPGDFFSKFSNIFHVIVAKEVTSSFDEQNLISFLRKSNVWCLTIAALFSQQLYDRLPSIKTITFLTIKKFSLQTSLNFLGDFKNLESISLYQSKISVNAIELAFKSSKYLFAFRFNEEDSRSESKLIVENFGMEVTGRHGSPYNLTILFEGLRIIECASLSELIRCLNEDENVQKNLRD